METPLDEARRRVRCGKCWWSYKANKSTCFCDYYLRTGRRRPCPPEDGSGRCTAFMDKKEGRRRYGVTEAHTEEDFYEP